MNIALEIGLYALLIMLGIIGVTAIYMTFRRVKKKLTHHKKHIEEVSIAPEVSSNSTKVTDEITPSDNFTQQLSIDDLHDVSPITTHEASQYDTKNDVEVNWPDDTSRADGPSYSVIQQLAATKHNPVESINSIVETLPSDDSTVRQDETSLPSKALNASFEPPGNVHLDHTIRADNALDSGDLTVRQDEPLITLEGIHTSKELSDNETLDRTIRAQDASYTMLKRLTARQQNETKQLEDVTLRASDTNSNLDENAPRRLGDSRRESLHVGEIQADWAYDIDTRESSYPPKPKTELEDATSETNPTQH